ncbi:hypothetical protein AYM11_03380, partial [Coxiella burnetii]
MKRIKKPFIYKFKTLKEILFYFLKIN